MEDLAVHGDYSWNSYTPSSSRGPEREQRRRRRPVDIEEDAAQQAKMSGHRSVRNGSSGKKWGSPYSQPKAPVPSHKAKPSSSPLRSRRMSPGSIAVRPTTARNAPADEHYVSGSEDELETIELMPEQVPQRGGPSRQPEEQRLRDISKGVKGQTAQREAAPPQLTRSAPRASTSREDIPRQRVQAASSPTKRTFPAMPHPEESEEEEPVEQFASSPPPEAPPIRQRQHGMLRAPAVSSTIFDRKNKMRKKDGTVIPPATTRTSKALIPSSHLDNKPIQGRVDWCTIGDNDNALNVLNLTLVRAQGVIALHPQQSYAGQTYSAVRINTSDIKFLERYANETPTFRLGLKISSTLKSNLDQLRKDRAKELCGEELFFAFEPEGDRESLRTALELKAMLESRGINYVANSNYIPRNDVGEKAAAAAEARMAKQAPSARATTSDAAPKTHQSQGKSKLPGRLDTQPTAQSERRLKPVGVSQPKLPFTARRQSARLTAEPAIDDDPVVMASKPPRLDKADILFPYPLRGKASLHISKGDKYRFEDNDYLNDTCLEFGLKFLMDKHATEAPKDVMHLFSSFFYDRISMKDKHHKPREDSWPGYDLVKKWTKSVDIFNKKLLIVPINESFHWFVAIIVNPAYVLNPSASTEDQSEAASRASSEDASATPSAEIPGAEGKSEADDSRDELDCISEPEGGDDVRSIKNGVHRIALEEAPQPVMSQTLRVFHDQATAFHRRSKSPPPAAAKRTTSRQDYDIANTEQTYIITFDSLGGTHRAVHNNLKRWLEYEARDKRNHHGPIAEPIYIDGRVPMQPNYSDCGVYLLHYIERLLCDIRTVLEFLGKAPPFQSATTRKAWEEEMNRVWEASVMPDLRSKWVEIIDDQTARWQSLQGVDTAQSTDGDPSKAEAAFTVASKNDDASAGPARATLDQSQPSVVAISQPPPHRHSPDSDGDRGERAIPMDAAAVALDEAVAGTIGAIVSPSAEPESDEGDEQPGTTGSTPPSIPSISAGDESNSVFDNLGDNAYESQVTSPAAVASRDPSPPQPVQASTRPRESMLQQWIHGRSSKAAAPRRSPEPPSDGQKPIRVTRRSQVPTETPTATAGPSGSSSPVLKRTANGPRRKRVKGSDDEQPTSPKPHKKSRSKKQGQNIADAIDVASD